MHGNAVNVNPRKRDHFVGAPHRSALVADFDQRGLGRLKLNSKQREKSINKDHQALHVGNRLRHQEEIVGKRDGVQIHLGERAIRVAAYDAHAPHPFGVQPAEHQREHAVELNWRGGATHAGASLVFKDFREAEICDELASGASARFVAQLGLKPV